MSQVPELALCACADNRHLLSHDDAAATRLLTIPATGLDPPQKTYGKSCDLTDLSAGQLKGMKLFVFELAPVPSEKFTIRWSKGFTGKV